jgi:cytochrome P450
VINGMFVPGRTSIGYCAIGIFRDRKTWGEDTDVFRPERFLEGELEKIRHLEQTLQLVFAQGKWQCLGQNVALIESNKVLVEVSILTLSQFLTRGRWLTMDDSF